MYEEILNHYFQQEQIDSLQYGHILVNMAQNEMILENNELADKYFKKSIDFFEKNLHKHILDFAIVLNKTGDFYTSIEDYKQANEFYSSALEKIAKLTGERNPFFAQTLAQSAKANYQSNRFHEAEILLQRAIHIFKETLGDQDLAYADALQSLGDVFQSTSQYTKAEPLYKNALKIRQDKLPASHLDLAQTQNNLAELYLAIENEAEAEKLFLEALKIRSKSTGKASKDYQRTLSNLIALYQHQNKTEKAYSLAKVWLEISQTEAKKYPENFAKALFTIGKLELAQGNDAEAEKQFLKASEFYQSNLIKNKSVCIDFLNQTARAYLHQKNFSQAQKWQTEAVNLTQKTFGENSSEYAAQLFNRSEIYLAQENWTEAESIFDKLIQIHQNDKAKNALDLAKIYHQQGILQKMKGNYAKAEIYFQQASAIRKEKLGTHHLDFSETQFQIAMLSKNLGRHETAENLLEEVLMIQKEILGELHPAYAQTLSVLAAAYRANQKNEAAEQLYKSSLQILKNKSGEQNMSYAVALDNLANFYQSKNRFFEAETNYLQALEIKKNQSNTNPIQYGVSLNNLAVLYEKMNKEEMAEKQYLKSLEIFKAKLGENHPDVAKLLNNLAALYEKQKRYKEAEIFYTKSVQIILHHIQHNFVALSESEKLFFYEKNKIFLQNFIHFAIQNATETKKNDLLSEVLNIQLQTKGILLESNRQQRNQILASQNKQISKDFEDWQKLRKIIAKESNVFEENNFEIPKHNLDSLELLANQLEKKLIAQSADFAEIVQTANWKAIQSKLKSNEAAIEIVRLHLNSQDIFYAFVAIQPNKSTPELILLSNAKELEGKYLSYYKNMIRFEGKDKYSFNKFFQPVLAHLNLPKGSKIYLSADGVYHQINLNTLRNPETSVFLMDEFEISLKGNLKELLKTETSQKLPKKALLIGRPNFRTHKQGDEVFFADLPKTEIEVKNIEKILSANQIQTKILLGKDAQTNTLENLQDVGILHIATHGYFVESEENLAINKNFEVQTTPTIHQNAMLRSGLVFAQTENQHNANEGLLTAYELSALQLTQNELVVLSACETGLGRIQNGEGVYGLQRALQTAGSKCILMSLWKVDDNVTQMLMTDFYQTWLKTGDKKKAFQTAQQKIRTEYPNPYYWGAFVMVGD